MQELVRTGAWEVDNYTITSEISKPHCINPNLHKYLYRNFAFWNNTITKHRTANSSCVELGIIAMHKSKRYMDFKRKHDKRDDTISVDINNKKLHDKKLVRQESGK